VTDPTQHDLRFQLDLFNLARGLDLGRYTGNAEASSLERLLEVCAKGRSEEPRLACEPGLA
jgi:hypothetical protein